MSFIETPRFPEDISYGAEGGPGYSTEMVTVYSGYESRNVNWSQARARYEASHGVRTKAQFDQLLAFFRSVKGMAHGFRFKDWADYQATTSEGRLVVPTGVAPGIYQLQKRYSAGALLEDRDIRKPVSGSVTIYRNAVAVAFGSSAGQVTLDETTGRATFAADSSVSITNITKANPGVITATAHGFVTGDLVGITGVSGMTQINNAFATVTKLTDDTFHLGIDTQQYHPYSSGGLAKKYGKAVDALTWAGEFDVPCRFDTDEMRAVNKTRGAPGAALLFGWESVPIVEIRV